METALWIIALVLGIPFAVGVLVWLGIVLFMVTTVIVVAIKGVKSHGGFKSSLRSVIRNRRKNK
jgi:hypothetical protein